MEHDAQEENLFSRKTILAASALAMLIAASAGVWFWRSALLKRAEEDIGKQQQKAEEERLKAVEEKISTVKGQLEELKTLTPEEKKKREEELKTLTQLSAVKDVSVEGVAVALSANKKIIKNIAQGYQIEMPPNIVIARTISSDFLELHDTDFICQDPSCDPVVKIEVSVINPKELTITQWLAAEERKAGMPIYSPRENLSIGGRVAWRVTSVIPGRFEGYYYYWAQGNKIYSIRVSRVDDERYRSYIQSFRFE